MLNRALFGEITQQKLDALQKEEDYGSCSELYQQSNLNIDNPDVRNLKTILYKILADYLIFEPMTNENLSYSITKPDISLFTAVPTNDPLYTNKMKAILSVLYYCIKNRGYNYALPANASHEEIHICDDLRDLLENNADYICNGNAELTNLMSELMVLLYDKLLGATVELVHSGEDVPTSISTFGVSDNFAFSKINYTNTTKVQKINALKLIVMDDYREQYIERRKFWKSNTRLPESKNFFLYGTYNLKEINDFLAQFDFKLFDITTPYYENYLCDGIFGINISQFKLLFYLLTDNQKKLRKLEKKHRNWSMNRGLQIKGALKSFIRAIAIALPLCLIFMPFGENVALPATLIPTCAVFLPSVNRKFEKKKRKIYSLFN